MSARTSSSESGQEDVLVLAPAGRDAAVTASVLSEAGLRPAICASMDDFCHRIEEGAGAGVIVEEMLVAGARDQLVRALARQPAWSDFPLVLLIGSAREARARPHTLELVQRAGNVALLERPMQRDTLLSALRVALRSRRRQYEIRDHLLEHERAAAALRESDQRFRIALGNSPITVAHVDRELRYTWIYNAHPAVAPERALGKRLDEILPSQGVAELTRIRQEVLESGDGLRREVTISLAGGRAIYDVAAEPLRDAGGNIVGVTTAATDVTELKRAEEERARLAAIVESSFDAIHSRATDGTITTWNAAAERIFGYAAAEVIGRDVVMLMPEERLDELATIRESLEKDEPVAPFETVRLTKAGKRLHVSITVSPLRSADGALVGASVITRDISERHRAEEHQKLLLAELSHRVKNTLAVVTSIASQTLAGAGSLADFDRSFRGRIHALSSAHSLLTAANWKSAELKALVEQALGPYLCDGGGNVEISGERVYLQPNAALTLGLVLHELTTNAAKHGALQKPGGRVAVGWSVEPDDGRKLHLRWTETGGPSARRPDRQGFGIRLIERSVAHELDGRTVLDYQPEGLSCEIMVPLPSNVEASAGAS